MKRKTSTFYIAAAALTAAFALLTWQWAARADILTQPPQTDVSIIALVPSSDTIVPTRPAFSGSFGVPVDPNSISVLLDQQDVSQSAWVSPTDFMVVAPSDLMPGQHTIVITGKARNGALFERSWSFVAPFDSISNFIGDLSPAEGSIVGPTLVVSGTTLPYAYVRVAVASSALPNGLLAANPGTLTVDEIADYNGQFYAPIDVSSLLGRPMTVRIVSIEPETKAGASATLDLEG